MPCTSYSGLLLKNLRLKEVTIRCAHMYVYIYIHICSYICTYGRDLTCIPELQAKYSRSLGGLPNIWTKQSDIRNHYGRKTGGRNHTSRNKHGGGLSKTNKPQLPTVAFLSKVSLSNPSIS